jgi:hypothetical protein
MESESARMSSAAEARFRIDYPNSKPRAVKVVALDAASERVVKEVAQRRGRARLSSPTQIRQPPRSGGGWSIAPGSATSPGRTKALVEEVATADLVGTVARRAPARRRPR